ncbi:hypothetical protein EW145_g7143, partial [Phellinidium pouzarii]
VDVVLLEADVFPRYHIGESMLASMRHLLRFIDLDTTFNEYGFTKKVGGAFKLNRNKREGFTDFIAAGGPENYSWNVVRSEADDLMFRHAGKCGARIFDGVRVSSVAFTSQPNRVQIKTEIETQNQERPVSAAWTRKSDSATGTIAFKYIIDASGRAGLLCTKYMKNRTYNQGLKNVANWGYWTGSGAYAEGTPRANSPFFEALHDESGWAWLIPLHNGTTSVGIVMNQDLATAKRQALTPVPSTLDFYLSQLELAPHLRAILGPTGSLIQPGIGGSGSGPAIKSASDYSYSSSSYGTPYIRIVGDAGAFIDPYFSSGVHLALTGALSAATTICAALRGDCSEPQAAKWHSDKIRAQEEPVLADFDEDNFDRAFALFRPVIQGAADIDRRLSQDELKKTLDFCANAFEPTLPEDRAAVLAKLSSSTAATATPSSGPLTIPSAKTPFYDANLTKEEQRVLAHINARKMMRTEDTMNIASFATDAFGGLMPRLEHGHLGLVGAAA